MNRKNFWLFAASMLLGALVVTACSDSNDNTGGGSDPASPVATDIVVMYYAMGGSNLDYDNETDLVLAANEIATRSRNVRYFAQVKYSAQKGYDKTQQESKKEDATWKYKMSGDYGCVYRWEVTADRVTKQSYNANSQIDLGHSGVGAFTFTADEKVGDASYKMYDPKNLADFIRYCMDKTPEAKAYALVIGDHGGAWMPQDDADKSTLPTKNASRRGILYDDNLNNANMSSQEIVTALKSLSAAQLQKIMLIDYDCCLMSNLETLGELIVDGKPLVPYVMGSSHSMPVGNQGTFCAYLSKAAQNGTVTQQAFAIQASAIPAALIEEKRKEFIKEGMKIDTYRNLDYTVTDMSKLPAAFDAIKQVTDFLVKQDVSGTAAAAEYNAAASKCYQFCNNFPFYDVVDYFNTLQSEVFPESDEFATLVSNATKAIRACMLGHADYSYSLDGVNGSTKTLPGGGLTYSIIIGTNASAFKYKNSSEFTSDKGVIMTYIKGKYDEQQFLNTLLLSNGNAYMSLYKKTDEHFNYNTVTHQAQESIGTPVSWDNTYKKTTFDKATGWSRWMLKNPGIPQGNPPLGDDNDRIGYQDLLEEYYRSMFE